MRYWHFSDIRNSPFMPAWLVPDLDRGACTGQLTHSAFMAATDTAAHMPPADVPSLAIVENLDENGILISARRMFTRYPDTEEWLRLERGCIVLGDSGIFYIIIDEMH